MLAENSPTNEKDTPPPVLCVDLDGTLLATDMLWESVLRLLKQRIYLAFALPFWLFRGKAYLKWKIAAHIKFDPASIPYREDVISFLIEEKKKGRHIVMVTASDRQLAEPIARHLGLFHDVFASDGELNLAGTAKRQRLEKSFGYRQFDYIGNSVADVAVWKSANAALLVDPSKRIVQIASRISSVRHVFRAKTNHLRSIVNAVRCHQWSKNFLIFVPILTSHHLLDRSLLVSALVAFTAMSFCASSIYIVNDLLDIEADRQHPRKKNRPFAAGTLSIPGGIVLVVILSVVGLCIAWLMLPRIFIGFLAAYISLSFSYSFLLKSKIVADVVTLALLYTLRILIGGAATGITISPWLLAFSMFIFLSLAFIKRYGEIGVLKKPIHGEIPGRGYVVDDKEWMRTMGGVSGYLSVLVFALYINSREVTSLYNHPEILWFACPPLLYWISRIWLLAARGKVDDDPLVFAAKDRVSYAVAIILTAAIVAAL